MFCLHWKSKILNIHLYPHQFVIEYSCFKCGKILKFRPQIIVQGFTLAENNKVIYPGNFVSPTLQ